VNVYNSTYVQKVYTGVRNMRAISQEITAILQQAAANKSRITGLTHNFYRYPARFSPIFVSAALRLFSKQGDLILDPYMGGGTTIVEAMATGRRTIGADLNALAVFITRVKTSPLTRKEKDIILLWSKEQVETLSYRNYSPKMDHLLNDIKTKNLTLPKARFLKKIIAQALLSLEALTSPRAQDFARCAILRTSQLALDGRKKHTSVAEFKKNLQKNVAQMLSHLACFERTIRQHRPGHPRRKLIESNAADLPLQPYFAASDRKVDLVITSPPYPGLHILYHRWQVDGRRETPAPYWIAGCQDGQGDSYYNFGSRHQVGFHRYFETAFQTLSAIRQVMRTGAVIVQMIAFKNPEQHLLRYLQTMEQAGFTELTHTPRQMQNSDARIWRDVPNRRWYATQKGRTAGSREVVLVHVAS